MYSLVLSAIVGAEIARLVPWWSVVVANVIWLVSLAGYLWLHHRGLVAELKREQESST